VNHIIYGGGGGVDHFMLSVSRSLQGNYGVKSSSGLAINFFHKFSSLIRKNISLQVLNQLCYIISISITFLRNVNFPFFFLIFFSFYFSLTISNPNLYQPCKNLNTSYLPPDLNEIFLRQSAEVRLCGASEDGTGA